MQFEQKQKQHILPLQHNTVTLPLSPQQTDSHIIQSYNVYIYISTNMIKHPYQLPPIFIPDVLPTQINLHVNALPNIPSIAHIQYIFVPNVDQHPYKIFPTPHSYYIHVIVRISAIILWSVWTESAIHVWHTSPDVYMIALILNEMVIVIGQ